LVILSAAKFDKFVQNYLLTGKSLPKVSKFTANKSNHNSGIESLIKPSCLIQQELYLGITL